MQKKQTNCAKCGACTAVCPVYRATGRESLSARGRLHLVNHPPGQPSAVFSAIFSQCLLCGACEEVCSRKIRIREIITQTRSSRFGSGKYTRIRRLAAGKTFSSSLLLKGLSRTQKMLARLPRESGIHPKLAVFPPELPTLPQPPAESEPDAEPQEGINYFSGCLAAYLAPDIKDATRNLTRRLTGHHCLHNEEQTCCGLASFTAGGKKTALKAARQNIEAFEHNSSPILTSCASCYSHLKTYPDLFADDPVWAGKARLFVRRLREFSSYMAGNLSGNYELRSDEKIRVAVHDPCHLRFGTEKILEPPRRLIRGGGNIFLEDIPGECCGHGGLFQILHPKLSRRIAAGRIETLTKAAPDYLLTTCSGCLLQLHKSVSESGLPVQTHHLAVFMNFFLS